jgi:phosphoglycerol transferase MdoB-like AlkP superfamily enzyme
MKHTKTTWNTVWGARRLWMLPLLLIVIFLVQTQVFNMWLNIQAVPSWQRLVSSLTIGLVAFGPAIALHRRGRYIWLTTAAVAVESLFVAQFIYYMSFDTFMRASALRYASYVGAVSGSIKTQLNVLLIFFVVMLPIIGLWYWFVDRKQSEPRYRRRTRLIILAGIMLLAFASFMTMLSIERKKHGGLRELLNVPYDNSTMVTKVGVHMYSALDTYRYFASPRGITEAEKQYVTDWNKNRPAPQAPGASFGIAKGKNVLMIQVESLNSFAIGRSIEGQEITPNINKLKAESMYYTNYHDQVGTGRTADAEFETQNSLLPTMDRVAFFEYATHEYDALPELLGDKGYYSGVFHGDVPTFWNRNVAYPYLGWDKYYSLDSFKINRAVGWGLSDEDLVRQSVPYLTKIKQPFYASVATVTSHVPFYLPDDLKPLKITDKQGLNQQQIDYIQTVAYTDKQIGLLIDELKKNGLYDNTIIALFGDHRGFITNQNDKAMARYLGLDSFDQASFFQDGEQISLLLHVPGSGLVGEDATPASHLDYAPTIMGLLGLQAPSTMLGQNLLAERRPVAMQRNSTGAIEVLETNDILYTNPGDNNFASGACYNPRDRKSIKLETCKAAYQEYSALAKVSDIVVRGNALYLLKK